MSTQPTDDQDGVVYVGPADCATGELEPFASTLEYIARLNAAGAKLEQQLAKLGPEFFVLAGGYGRAEVWSPDAIVVGPPGVFLIHVVWGRAELPLWYSSESCRLHILKGLGPGFTGMVEVVFFSPGAGEGEQMERLVFPPAVGSRGFNVLKVVRRRPRWRARRVRARGGSDLPGMAGASAQAGRTSLGARRAGSPGAAAAAERLRGVAGGHRSR